MAKDIIEKIAEAPAAALDATITETEHLAKNIPKNGTLKKTRRYWNVLGPGLTTGASDDDPSGIATYSQTGAQYGFQLLWLSIVTFPLMAIVQEMCARIGMVTGRGLAGNIREHFSKRIFISARYYFLQRMRLISVPTLGLWQKPYNFYTAVLIFMRQLLDLRSYRYYSKFIYHMPNMHTI
jgi:hypothetical protein